MSYTQEKILDEIDMALYTDDNGDYLRCLSASNHTNCKEFMLKVVEKELEDDWALNSLYDASEELKNDVDFLLQVAKLIKSVSGHTTRGYELLEYTEPSEDTINKITNCKKTLIQFLDLDVPLLHKAPQKFLDDKDVVMAAVKYNRDTLKLASDRLKDNKDFVLEAIKNNRSFIDLVSKRLINDKDVVIAAGSHGLKVTETLKNDREVLMAIAKNDPWFLSDATPSVRKDIEIVCICCRLRPEVIKYAHPDLIAELITMLYQQTKKRKKGEINNA